MCGIGGVFLVNQKNLSENSSKALCIMKDFMKNRGPDGNGIVIDKNVGLVHTRLSIIDIAERSNQPMQSQHWILSFNGEIINYKTIRQQLIYKYHFNTESDTEVLLYSLEEWGIEKTLKKCAGMFAFLAYHKTTGHFYAARDPMGIKPLFFFYDNDEYWFASTPATIKAALPKKQWEIHKPAIGSYFALGAPFTQISTTLGIRQVAPASYISIDPNGAIQYKKYWAPEFQTNFTMNDLMDIILEYKNTDVKSALFLSGGIDSTFLATVMHDLDFFHLNSAELSYAKRVANQYKKSLIVVNPEVNSYFDGLKKVSHTFGEPLMSAGIPFSVSASVVKYGYKMAISANGADELFLGYPRTPLDFSIKKFNKNDFNTNQWFDYQIAHIFRNKTYFSIEEYDAYIPSLVDIRFNVIKNCSLANFDVQANYRWIELMTYVLNDLNPTLDAASMANSLEVRVPFLDHRIVQGILSWSAERLYNETLGRKAPLKEQILPIFGKEFIHRPKLGFSLDRSVLSKINKQTENDFENMMQTQFIKLHSKNSSSTNYERDMLLLKPICQVYKTWNNGASNAK